MTLSDDNTLSARIEGNLIRRIDAAASRPAFLSFLKKRILKYKRKSPDWVRFVDKSFSWISGQYAQGLTASGSANAVRALTRYYDKLLLVKRFGLPVFELPDQIVHADVMLTLYERFGKRRYQPLIREAAKLLTQIAAENEGLVIYWPPEQEILVDTLGMISDFCCHYETVFGDSGPAEIAGQQLRFTEERCIDPGSGFPFHAFDLKTGCLGGSSTWGRGVGWYLLGLTAGAERDPTQRVRLLQVFGLVFRTQNADGFLWNDLAEQGHIDSSPTCMAALCLARCLDRELFGEEQSIELAGWLQGCLRALRASVNETGEVLNCSGECEGAGIYSQKYGNYFSQGYTLMLFEMLRRSEKLQRYLSASDEVTQ